MYMFRLVETHSEEYTKEVAYENTSHIVVGKRYNISPSQGYLGITRGYVEVVALATPEDIGNERVPHEIVKLIKDYIDTTLYQYTDRQEEPIEPEYSDMAEHLDTTVWVAYKYPHGNNGESENDIYVFPMEDFVAHTSLF